MGLSIDGSIRERSAIASELRSDPLFGQSFTVIDGNLVRNFDFLMPVFLGGKSNLSIIRNKWERAIQQERTTNEWNELTPLQIRLNPVKAALNQEFNRVLENSGANTEMTIFFRDE